MTNIQQQQEPNEDILRKTQKLLDLAAKAGTPAEAAAATAKANEFMEQYNLTAAMLERREGKDGKRKQDEVRGGQYLWQRELWKNVAWLNFCLHWTQEYITVRERTERATHYPRVYYKGQQLIRKRHAIVGRIVNVEATKAMATYLEQAITRLLRERLTDSAGNFNHKDFTGRFGLSFKEGAADVIIGKLQDRRRKVLAAEMRRKKAAGSKASTGTDLSLTVYIDEETDANMDFIHGAGYSANKAKAEMERAQRRKEEQEAYTQWAKDHPEEAKAQAAEAAKRARRRGGWSAPREREKDWSAYRMGEEAGESISLDKQAEGPSDAKRITGSKAIHMGAR